MTSWVPEKFAKQGKYLKLKEDDGWKVVEVYAKLPEEQIKNYSHDYKRWSIGRGLHD